MTVSIHHQNRDDVDLLNRLGRFAESLDLHLVGTAPLQQDDLGWFSPHRERLKDWVAKDKHADMSWFADRLEERCVPHSLLPNAKSALVFWISHYFEPYPDPVYLSAKVARYAWGRDYHNVLRKALRKIQMWLKKEIGPFNSYTSVDTGAVLERSFGERANLGWIGRSNMLINPKLGTFGSLGVIFLDYPLQHDEEGHPFRCGTCTQCITDCPTDALDENGLDSRLCISYWTIEHRGLIPADFRPKIEDWVFGCDICQDVCPWNRKAPYVSPDRWQPKAAHARPNLVEWLETPAEELDQVLLGSPLRRAKPEGLKRNACIVLANQESVHALPVLENVARLDPSPVVRATAIWACVQLGHEEILELTKDDVATEVQEERETLLRQFRQPLP